MFCSTLFSTPRPQNLHHMYRAYGGWTFAFKDYLDLNITMYLDDPRLGQLAAIVDPYGEELLTHRGRTKTKQNTQNNWSLLVLLTAITKTDDSNWLGLSSIMQHTLIAWRCQNWWFALEETSSSKTMTHTTTGTSSKERNTFGQSSSSHKSITFQFSCLLYLFHQLLMYCCFDFLCTREKYIRSVFYYIQTSVTLHLSYLFTHFISMYCFTAMTIMWQFSVQPLLG